MSVDSASPYFFGDWEPLVISIDEPSVFDEAEAAAAQAATQWMVTGCATCPNLGAHILKAIYPFTRLRPSPVQVLPTT